MKTSSTENMLVGSRTTTKHGDGGREEIENNTDRKQKSILVFDTPKNCAECKLMYLQGIGEGICNAVDWERRPSWCPLRPLPEIKYISSNDTHDDLMFQMGWNACLDEILGATE